jgi:endonuclease/exonuclease/phosphatase (EEP) superfamily protein YafD
MARSIFIILLLAVVAAFAALNWPAFATPTTLWVGFTTVEAPVGVVMLCVLGLVCVAFVAWVIYLQGVVMIESRRQAKELQAQRDLAERAEASRFTELRDFMATELLRVTRSAEDARAVTLARLADLEQRQRVMLEETTNSLSAYIGSLEDRIEHRALPPEVVRTADHHLVR